MLVFHDHSRKHRVLTTALQNVPNECRAERSMGGKTCRGKGREPSIFPGRLGSGRQLPYLPAPSLITPWRTVISYLSLQQRMKMMGPEDRDLGPSFLGNLGVQRRCLPTLLPFSEDHHHASPCWKGGLCPTHQATPPTWLKLSGVAEVRWPDPLPDVPIRQRPAGVAHWSWRRAGCRLPSSDIFPKENILLSYHSCPSCSIRYPQMSPYNKPSFCLN